MLIFKDLEKAKKVYIVMDAYCVTNLRMHIIVDGMEKVTVREGEHLPIGFTLDKFRLSDDGVLTPASKKASNQDRPWSSMKSREASQWARRSTVRNPRDPLPPAPSGMDEGGQKAAKRNPTDPLPAPPRRGKVIFYHKLLPVNLSMFLQIIKLNDHACTIWLFTITV